MNEIEKYKEWLKRQNLKRNPFTLEINPDLLVGYENQISSIMKNLEQQQKILLITGPTGSGKTSIISFLCSKNNNYLFLSKPPKINELLEIYTYFLKDVGFFRRLFIKKPKKLQELPFFLNKITTTHKVIFIDEAHEADIEVLEWLRVFSDQVKNLSIVFSALPIFEEILTKNLETLKKRITEKIELISLSKKEIVELIRKRIEYNGGQDIKPFTYDIIDYIYSRTGGFPRDIIVLCNKLFNLGIEKNVDVIDTSIIDEIKIEKKVEINKNFLELPLKQRKIIDILLEKEPLLPTELLKYTDYPSEEKGLRAINNLLNRLLKEGYVEREKCGKSYYYKLTPSTRTSLIRG